MIRRDDAPARAIGGPSRVANFQRLQAAAAIKLQVFLGLGRCDQRACVLLNHRAKARSWAFRSRPSVTWPASFPRPGWVLNCLTRKNKSSRFSLYRLQKASEGASAVQCEARTYLLLRGRSARWQACRDNCPQSVTSIA